MQARRRILILGGTGEASALARRLARRFDVTSSLAGRTAAPVRPEGQLRIGGFGGADGLARYVRAERTDAVIDALHPFAARMPWNAEAACRAAGVPLVRVERPAWTEAPGDRWVHVPDLAAAAAALAGSERIFLTTGRQELAPFAGLAGKWFLVRSIEPPGPLPFAGESVLARGPFTIAGEEALMRRFAIDTLVTKNSGAGATAAKLAAARALGLATVMVERPPKPPVPTVADPDAAVSWLDMLFPPAAVA